MVNHTKIDRKLLNNILFLEDKNINFLSVCGPQLGVYYRPLSDKTDTYTTDTGEEELQVNLNQYGITVSVEHAENVYFGMNINYLSGMAGYSVIQGTSPEIKISDGVGWGLDWGIIYDISEFINVGITVLNGPGRFYWDKFDTSYLPLIIRAGMDIQLTNLMSMGIDYENGLYDDTVSDQSDLIRLGIEHYLAENFIIRGGMYGSDLEDKYKTTYTGGIGYKKENYLLDIAVRQFFLQDEGKEVRRLSLSGVLPF